MILQGEIEEILDTKVISEKFTIREFIIKVPGKYPELIIFQTSNATLTLVDKLKIGEWVTVHFEISGRMNAGRCWNTLKAYKIDLQVMETSVAKPLPQLKETQEMPPLPPVTDDDLPF